jgi:hypothetical protein
VYFLSYHPHESCLVIEVRDVVDFDNERVVEQELRRLLPRCGARTVVVDVCTPVVTPSALRVLSRVRGLAEERGVTLVVVARHALAREVSVSPGAAGP